MEESFSKSIITKIGIAILTIALVDLFYLNYWILQSEKLKVESGKFGQDNRQLEPELSGSPNAESPTPVVSPSPIPEPALNQTTLKTITVVQTAQKEIFIPIGSGSTKSGTFADLSGVEVTIDTTKYSEIESVVFEASLWTDGGNGRAWAKLKNVSDNNPFIESQISATSGAGEVKTSGKVPILAGAKKYGVQAKTDLVDYYAHVDNARIKITLK